MVFHRRCDLREARPFQKELGARRVVNFDDHMSPRMEVYDPDFTVSAIVLEGAKFPIAANPSFK